MHNLIKFLRDSKKTRKILYLFNIVFLGLYTFSIPSFSGRQSYNLFAYGFMAILIFFSLSYSYLYKTFKFKFRLLIVPLFVIIAFFGTLLFSKAYRSLLTIALLAITFFIFYIVFCNIDNYSLSLVVLSISLFAFSIYFIYIYKDYLIEGINGRIRLGSYFSNVNEVASYCFVGFTLSCSIALFSKYKWRLLLLVSASLLLFVGFLTGSRSFLVNVFFSCLIFSYLKLKNYKTIFLISVFCVVALSVVLINMDFMSSMKQKMINAFTTISGYGGGKIDSSTLTRVLWQKYGIYLGSKNILLGYGCDGFSIYSGVGTYTHGNFSEILCNFGVFGCFVFYFIFILPSILLLKKKDSNLYFLFCFIFYEFLTSILGVNYCHKDTYIIIALLFYLTKDVDLLMFKQKQISRCYEVRI